VFKPSESIGGIEVNVHVIICLDNKFSLLTEGWDPELSKYIFVGEVVIGVKKATLKSMKVVFIFFVHDYM
jgi:hypothetical protein